MLVVGDTIIFKSTDTSFWKELRVKSNTIRKIPIEEQWKFDLSVMPDGRLYAINSHGRHVMVTHISIRNSDYPSVDAIERSLKDVTVYDGYYLFSW